MADARERRPEIVVHAYAGLPLRLDARARTSCGHPAKGRAMRERRWFVEERGRRRCAWCVRVLEREEVCRRG